MTLTAMRLGASDLASLSALLAAATLPVADLDQPGRCFFRFDDEETLVGYGGLEGGGHERLLRSLIVVQSKRGHGIGAHILDAIETEAAAIGVRRLHLLTTTAATFFGRHGYRAADRASAPSEIAASAEFAGLCPASAAYLVKNLDQTI